MKQTSKYHLNQWDKEDRLLREDFNGDNGKLEAALAGIQAELGEKGNCQLWITDYVGTGTYGGKTPCMLTFDSPPLLVVISGPEGYTLHLISGSDSAALVYANSADEDTVSWNGNSVSWYNHTSADHQFNRSGFTYHVVAFLAAD